jgi:A/G-specific adenine glycosylase
VSAHDQAGTARRRRAPSDPVAEVSDTEAEAFRAYVRERGRALYREMPWRRSDDPYAVLVSEVMLQQTQVVRVLRVYPEWIEAFPTFDALAAAPLTAVLDRWQGLGYNRRAVALRLCAQTVVERFDGRLPEEPAALRRLPGIGPATAAAVVNYAYAVPAPFVETNVRSVYLHHFFADAADVPDRVLIPLVEATWDLEEPRAWGYALMDYGAWLKRTVPNPSRRSSHHVRQSPFEGSRRQKRSRLLRQVMARPGRSGEEYAADLGLVPGEADRLLEEMAGEGFLERSGGTWVVRG